MLVAICDDDPVFRSEISRMITEHLKKHRVGVKIVEFEDGDSLLGSGDVFDMVLIDYLMPGTDGLETAKKMRARRYVCSIIFVTSYPQFILDSFEVQPFRFFIKPVDVNKLEAALNSYLEQQRQLNPIVILDEGKRHTIKTEDIIYLEADGRNSIIRTKDKSYQCSKNLSMLQKMLPMFCFYRVHKSYIINMYCIFTIRKNEIGLINGEKAMISRSNLAGFKRAYAEFVKNIELME